MPSDCPNRREGIWSIDKIHGALRFPSSDDFRGFIDSTLWIGRGNRGFPTLRIPLHQTGAGPDVHSLITCPKAVEHPSYLLG